MFVRSALMSAMRVVFIPAAAYLKPEDKSFEQKKKIVCRPSELPIYCPDVPKPKCIDEKSTWFGNLLLRKVSGMREVVSRIVFEAQAYETVVEEYVKQGIDQADDALNYLRKENNTAPKVGAIAIGGLTGLILSLRKGYFKRTLYITTGTLIMTAVCYPKLTSDYVHIAVEEGKKYATIGYNFAYGVKKGDPPVELPSLPQLPSSVSDVWESIYKTVSSLFLDKADSDDKCHRRYTGDGDDEEHEEECRCFESGDDDIICTHQ